MEALWTAWKLCRDSWSSCLLYTSIAQLHHDHEFSEKLLKDFRSHFTNIDFFVLLTEEMKEELEKIMADNHHTKLLAIPHFLPEMKEYAKTVSYTHLDVYKRQT